MFYACSLYPDVCGDGFAIFLTEIFIDEDKKEDAITR